MSMTIFRSDCRCFLVRFWKMSQFSSCRSLKPTARWWFSNTDESLYMSASSESGQRTNLAIIVGVHQTFKSTTCFTWVFQQSHKWKPSLWWMKMRWNLKTERHLAYIICVFVQQRCKCKILHLSNRIRCSIKTEFPLLIGLSKFYMYRVCTCITIHLLLVEQVQQTQQHVFHWEVSPLWVIWRSSGCI